MNEKQQKAVELFLSGCNCCQAVVAVFAEGYGLPEGMALRLGAAFGGGMRRKEVCGAVSGALLALGMRYGQDRPDDRERKDDANARTIEFMKAFEERHGSYLCRDLLGGKSWKEVCPALVAAAVAQAEEFGI